MRLKHIKLVGFKSFVDPTTVPLPTNLTAIVGPNGCGKSNIIDAVRWVMGESSAKQLRGQSLGDVIFNGSGNRKPLGQAAIELVFDNSDQTLTGQYAAYSEIGLRREITREGQSNYYLNGARCRRRDITDLFLGTGLGPRSYAIIEQGTISRLIEAKPDDLRSFIEEAAGVSKYKERRHETELRISHTEENLARLNDIREELNKQLNHLQRQANAAERYKVLKEEERLLKAQIYSVRWRILDEQMASQKNAIQQKEEEMAQLLASQEQLEIKLEENRQLQADLMNENNEIQSHYYQTSSEANRLEQTIQTQQEKRDQWQQEYQTLATTQQDTQQHLSLVDQRIAQLVEELNVIAPKSEQAKVVLEQSQQALTQAENEIHTWQIQWDDVNQQVAQSTQQIEVEQTRIQHLQQRLHSNQQRLERMQGEHRQQELALGDVPKVNFEGQLSDIHQLRTELEEQLHAVKQAIGEKRQQQQSLQHELEKIKTQVQQYREQQASLEAVQQVALGRREEVAMEWLKKYQLADLPRFAQLLQVETGWERAVEAVLDHYLQAVCMDDLPGFVSQLEDFPQANLSLMAKTMPQTPTSNSMNAKSLASKIKAPQGLDHLVSSIYIAETVAEATQLLSNVAKHESIVTKDGVWLGHGWLYIAHKTDVTTGVLQRERELISLRQELSEIVLKVESYQANLQQGQTELHASEEQRDTLQKQLTELVAQQAELKTKQQVQEAQINQIQKRAQQITHEITECTRQIESDQQALSTTQEAWQAAHDSLQQQTGERERLLQVKNEYQTALEAAKQKAQTDRNVAHQFELELQAAKLQSETAEQNKLRLEQQLQDLANRETYLQKALADSIAPLKELSENLQQVIAQKDDLAQKLAIAKEKLENVEQELRKFEQQRQHLDKEILEQRNSLEQLRLNAQGDAVRAKGLEEQILESGHDLGALLAELPAELNLTEWEEKLSQVTRKIERLGAINLAAIDEHQVQSERKEYLDKQHADLTEALDALQDAMKKMDQETKSRFKETYEKINHNFQNLFPTLFGGGRASLQLEENDLLEAGISVMAQPPGKRNSTIHLLSGGEKALTAIALVFSMFKLNPAPFCMLDEVDAPLDDANVARFCNLVKHMSNTVQFIFISHNKLAIEMAEQLAGVTMHEAGVSRMVAVNVEEAIAMAAA